MEGENAACCGCFSGRQALCGILTATRISNALYRGISVGLLVMVCFVGDGRI